MSEESNTSMVHCPNCDQLVIGAADCPYCGKNISFGIATHDIALGKSIGLYEDQPEYHTSYIKEELPGMWSGEESISRVTIAEWNRMQHEIIGKVVAQVVGRKPEAEDWEKVLLTSRYDIYDGYQIYYDSVFLGTVKANLEKLAVIFEPSMETAE